MKKLLILSAAGLIMASLPAFAEAPAPANDTEAKTESTKSDKKGAYKEGMGQRLEDADANGDGMIEKSEFMAVSEKRFAEMDTDGDGKITKAEVEKRREEWRQKMKERRAERKKMMEEKKAKAEKPAEKPAQ
jgi:hypothetical protein